MVDPLDVLSHSECQNILNHYLFGGGAVDGMF